MAVEAPPRESSFLIDCPQCGADRFVFTFVEYSRGHVQCERCGARVPDRAVQERYLAF